MRFWALVILLLGFSGAFAQNDDYQEGNDSLYLRSSKWQRTGFKDYNGFLKINVGPSIPAGDYGDDNIFFNPDAELANTGVDLNVNLGRHFNQYVGISTTFGYFKNPVDRQTIANALSIGAPGPISDFKYKGYQSAFLSTGLFVRVPVENLSFDLKLEGGIAYGVDTEASFTVNDTFSKFDVVIEKAGDVSYIFTTGIALNYMVKDYIFLSLNLDYRSTLYNYTNVQTFINGIPAGADSYSLNVRVISVDIGIGFAF